MGVGVTTSDRASAIGWLDHHPMALVILLVLFSSVSAEAAPITIAWNPIPDPTVIGYQVYVGAASGSYSETFDVGLAASFSYFPTGGSVYYYFAVAAYAPGPVL